MKIELHESTRLPSGRARFPGGLSGSGVLLRLGCVAVPVTLAAPGPSGEIHLARDLWQRLAIPYRGIRLELTERAPGEFELGPTVGVLYPGRETIGQREARERAELYYGHLQGLPGILAIGFDEEVDWEKDHMSGYVLDNRPGREGRLVRTTFPIPVAVRLTWSILRDVVQKLRELTENRTFNWVRSIGKWQFHRLLSAVEELRLHLPETRVLAGAPDLAAMLIRHEVVFVKHEHGIKGRNALRIRRTPTGFDLVHVGDSGQQQESSFTSLGELMPYLRQVTGEGRCVVQQAIPIAGKEGRSLDFRLVTVRRPEGGWRLVVGTANVAPDDQVAFTNLANGATDEEMIESLRRHHGMTPEEARRCADQMADLCLAAASTLEQAFAPLGLIGFDVAVEADNHRIWFFEANAVPGWGYPAVVEEDLARSQIDLALSLTGFQPSRPPSRGH